ncbi:MAG TPA: hypothetical protein VHA11_03245 [Bryobacteraceae bacterium]|nr:hypothetical protein [Bryobacteraceae bacterium]
MKLRTQIFAALPLVLLLGSCSDQPKPAQKSAEAAKPAEPVTALSAVYKMYTQARSWAPDCKLLRVGSLTIPEVKNAAGKAGAWEATFVSESAQRARRYTFSVVESPAANLHEGVFGGSVDSWSGSRQFKPFLIQAFKTDSTAAYETALKNKGADYAAKHPELSVLFLLEQTSRFPDPAWRVVWGESVSTSGFSVFIDSTTGGFLQTSK